MIQLSDNAINVFTDGSSYNGPRKGGVGVRFVVTGADGHEHAHDLVLLGEHGATNNRMELQAVISSLEALNRHDVPVDKSAYDKVVIHTDSMYVCDNVRNAQFTWSRHGWRNSSGRPILNADLWKVLVKLIAKFGMRVEFKWVKGHKGHEHNEAVDKLAKASAKGPLAPQSNVVKLRKKWTTEQAVPDGFEMRGQTEIIRVINDEYLTASRANKYVVEVVDPLSSDLGRTAMVFSDRSVHLSAGHVYEVRFNDDSDNPTVLERIEERDPSDFKPDR